MLKKNSVVILISFILSGCSSVDPFEKANRKIFQFNEKVDQYALKPLAQGYQTITPKPVRKMVSNFYANIGDIYSFANNILQLKIRQASEDLIRVSINTTFGIGGMIDIASAGGIPRYNEDLGQTLGYWGIGNGPYLVLPILGPSTLRDTIGDAAESSIGFTRLFADKDAMLIIYNGVNLIQLRANLLDFSNNIDEVALDKYNFIKNAYLQKRRYDVLDGVVPEENEELPANSDNSQINNSSI